MQVRRQARPVRNPEAARFVNVLVGGVARSPARTGPAPIVGPKPRHRAGLCSSEPQRPIYHFSYVVAVASFPFAPFAAASSAL